MWNSHHQSGNLWWLKRWHNEDVMRYKQLARRHQGQKPFFKASRRGISGGIAGIGEYHQAAFRQHRGRRSRRVSARLRTRHGGDVAKISFTGAALPHLCAIAFSLRNAGYHHSLSLIFSSRVAA